MHNEGVSLQVFDSPALTRAARSIRASGLFRPREKRWITLPVVERMLEWAKENRGYNTFVALFAISYIFLLRLPSEALPMRIGPVDDDSSQSVLEYRDDKLVLNLKRRKNRPLGGTLTRDCWCACVSHRCADQICRSIELLYPKSRPGLFWITIQSELMNACQCERLRIYLFYLPVQVTDGYKSSWTQNVADGLPSSQSASVLCVTR